MNFDDRRVHARGRGVEVVRYDRRSKWYVCFSAGHGRAGLPAEEVLVDVRLAAENARAIAKRGGDVFLGLPGGRVFDRLVAS